MFHYPAFTVDKCRARQINASQEMERNLPTAELELLAATGSAWLVFSFPPFPVPILSERTVNMENKSHKFYAVIPLSPLSKEGEGVGGTTINSKF